MTNPIPSPLLAARHPRHVARRTFLRSLSASAVAAPFLRPRAARGAVTGPRNLVVVTWPEGLETGWQPVGTESAFEFKDVLAPFNPFRDRLTAISGIKCGSGNIILQHSESTISMWTGCKPGAFASLATGPSFEQLVAAKIGASTPYKSLHFGTQTNRPSVISSPYVHFAGAKQPIPAEDDPSAMYKLIFGGLSQDAAALDRVRGERRSVLDFLNGRLKALRPQVAAEDRPKLDKHADSLRAIEKSLDGLAKSCGATIGAPTLTKAAALADENFPAAIKLQTDLLATALQCGVTRVATLQLSNTDSQTHIPGVMTKRTVHDAEHSGTRDERVDINRFFAKQLAYVLERLKAVDLGGGRTLLDDTLVVMSSEMSVGGHGFDPIPFFLAGNGGATVKMGRFLKAAGLPRHTKPLTNVLHAFGVDEVKTFGEFTGSDAEGELAELRG